MSEAPPSLDVLAAIPGGLAIVGADGTVEWRNDEARRLLGTTLAAVCGPNPVDGIELIGEDGSPLTHEQGPVARARATASPVGPVTIGVRQGEITTWCAFRAVPTVGGDGSIVRVALGFVEAPPRVRTEEALRASEQRWRSLAQSLPDFVVVVDNDLTLRWVNRVLPDVPMDAVVGQQVESFLITEDAGSTLNHLRHVLADGNVRQFELRGLGPNGTRASYLTHAAPMWEDGRITGAVLVARDITDLLALRAQLARSERMASLGLIAAGVAHEINNPLTYIRANLGFVQRSLGEASELVVEALGDAQSGVDRVSGIVRDLQSFSAATDTPNELVDPVAIVDSALTLVRNELRHRARVVRDYGVVPAVEASPARLGQIVLNLLVNAGQSIASGDAERNEIRVSVGMVAGHVEIAVRDSGRGIATEDLERVFEPFFTTRPLGQGAGLGLSICHDHVMRLGGSITVDSAPNRGSTFSVRLPPAAAIPTTHEPALPTRPLVILVVDDNPAVARAMSRILDGHRVEVALDAESAAQRLTVHHFDAVVCDVMMPNEGGLALHAQVRARDPLLADRFVFVSGGVFESGVRDALAALGNPVVDKPISAAELSQALARVTGPSVRSNVG